MCVGSVCGLLACARTWMFPLCSSSLSVYVDCVVASVLRCCGCDSMLFSVFIFLLRCIRHVITAIHPFTFLYGNGAKQAFLYIQPASRLLMQGGGKNGGSYFVALPLVGHVAVLGVYAPALSTWFCGERS
ncbi:hypothetical protein ABB37_08586 [Leptomonas pyrrhocoris]|uniref:Uncharacterized protein n=1 Tax=Leptomonas pyrrhocoris TaxID=157538 RepID=A0A0M9FSQ9_LEPPY|nr:hypothetical protein ABB37_08586 [Leptomonas pyrrhocoris]KPA75285.1 hypothetical protein ABB37_08586 [Leptomonas pyrrhocoris]|eukprot:XP_015653724.1 hypothetical protein ABB37_08586 [Leptomonas pyrrhocoris]